MISKEEAIKYYNDLITFRKSNPLFKSKKSLGSVETHHIQPTSCGGQNIAENKINLLAKEHFMAHVYLWIIHHDDEYHSQTTYALSNMIKGTLNGSRSDLRSFILESEEYQKAKEECAILKSQTMGSKIRGENNGSYGKHWYYNPTTLESHLYLDSDIPEGWIKGRPFSEEFAKKIAKIVQNRIWIHSIDNTQQKFITKEDGEKLIESGLWTYGHLKYTEETKKLKYFKFIETKMDGKEKQQHFCKNCGKEILSRNSSYCSEECLMQKVKEQKEKRIEDKISEITKNGIFDCQRNKFYNGQVNRKQVRMYLLHTGHNKCEKCGKTDCELVAHPIDGNSKNLKIDNYEFLCRDCYLKSGMAGFSGKSMKEIILKKKNLVDSEQQI